MAYETLVKLSEFIESGRNAREFPMDDFQAGIISEIQLLTNKPVLYVCNVDENSVKNGNPWIEKIEAMAKAESAETIALAAQIEADINELETFEERQIFLEELGLEKRTRRKPSYPCSIYFIKSSDIFHCRSKRSKSMDYREKDGLLHRLPELSILTLKRIYPCRSNKI